MKRFVKIAAIALVLLMLVSSFVACGGNEGSETDPKETESQSTETEAGVDSEPYVKDDVPTDLRFNGETVTFFTRDDTEAWLYEMDCDAIMNDTLYDAIYYRNITVEERLGVTITTIHQKGSNNNAGAWNDAYRVAVNNKTGDFDAAAMYTSQGSVLAVEGIFYNVVDFPYISLDKPWWNQSLREELTLFNTLYFLAGDITISQITCGEALFYNKDLMDKYFPNGEIDLYQVVEDKKWTIDYMYDIVSQVHEDVDGSGTVTDGDVVGFLDGDFASNGEANRDAWIAACGIKITEMVGGLPEYSFYSTRTVNAFEKVKRLNQSPGTLCLSYPETTKFENGNVLFDMDRLRAGSLFRTMENRYGVLPLPMYEENQEGGYKTVVFNGASMATIPSSLPDERKDVVGATLELMAAESYRQVRPAYCEVALKTKYSEDPKDAAMYDLIIDSFHYNFGFIYSTKSLGGVGNLFRNLGNDIAQKWDENDEVYQEKLNELIDGLDEVSFIANYGGAS